MNNKAKNISWVSYVAIVLSILPISFYFIWLYNINLTDYITMPLITTILIIAFLFAVIGVFKKAESKIILSIALVIILGSGFFIGLIAIVSGMAQPT